nr:immunoglobulin heavy chain junction region [Mus musculus]NSM04430.1 immunoglobulin heavy chain junction region [Mus musculus]NSM04838.1 immunoglobulin heavy chain junction region [Mus musculus]NSM06694.1 immunoglobulin heavy chain junction region [Mus musculus]NSM06952.1 immunoglobulin heavy chain junction region [Mus musculus]
CARDYYGSSYPYYFDYW